MHAIMTWTPTHVGTQNTRSSLCLSGGDLGTTLSHIVIVLVGSSGFWIVEIIVHMAMYNNLHVLECGHHRKDGMALCAI